MVEVFILPADFAFKVREPDFVRKVMRCWEPFFVLLYNSWFDVYLYVWILNTGKPCLAELLCRNILFKMDLEFFICRLCLNLLDSASFGTFVLVFFTSWIQGHKCASCLLHLPLFLIRNQCIVFLRINEQVIRSSLPNRKLIVLFLNCSCWSGSRFNMFVQDVRKLTISSFWGSCCSHNHFLLLLYIIYNISGVFLFLRIEICCSSLWFFFLVYKLVDHLIESERV